VVRAFAILPREGAATLFIDPAKISAQVAAHLGADTRVEPYEAVGAALERFEGRLLVDPARTVAAVHDHLERGSATVIAGRDPVVGLKAVKNAVEADGVRAAHVRDGLALTRFLHSLEAAPPRDELEAEARLESIRRESNLLVDLSFDTISSFGPNGAIVHYRASPETSRAFEGDSLYLVDSGGQYPDGTTDVTRTVAWGTPDAAMRDGFTRVLKGHIALATARFPEGTRGGQLDVLARQYLWAAGRDYAHGTGHGVGHFLAVHEGPQRIAASAAAVGIDEPLRAGMLLSNEPGYYVEGRWGIRIENLVLVTADPRPEDERPMLAFETVTLAPIDLRLVEPAMLSADEIAWLDAYHARVRAAHAPNLSGAARDWLVQATRPIAT
jgi:Xaa-Pro aminopeptidase